MHLIPFLNKSLSLTKNWLVVAQFIAPLTCGYLIVSQNLYNETLFFRFGIRVLIRGIFAGGVFAWVFLRISSIGR